MRQLNYCLFFIGGQGAVAFIKKTTLSLWMHLKVIKIFKIQEKTKQNHWQANLIIFWWISKKIDLWRIASNQEYYVLVKLTLNKPLYFRLTVTKMRQEEDEVDNKRRLTFRYNNNVSLTSRWCLGREESDACRRMKETNREK